MNIIWLIVGIAVLAGGGWYLHQQKLEREAKARAKAQVEKILRGPRAPRASGRSLSLHDSAVNSAKAMAGSVQKARGAANVMSAAGEESKRETDRALGLNPDR